MTAVLGESQTPEQIAGIRRRFGEIGVAQIADAAKDVVRVLRLDLHARTPARHVCGPLFPVETDNDMLPGLQALAAAPAGHVILIVNRTEPSEALVGDIFALAAQEQGMGGIIVDGAARDLLDLAELEIPVFSTAVTFVSARTTEERAPQVPCEVRTGGLTISPGDWVFGDPDGCLVVPAEHLGPVMMGGRLLREREGKLKEALRRGERLSKLTGLDDFLAGTGRLGYVP